MHLLLTELSGCYNNANFPKVSYSGISGIQDRKTILARGYNFMNPTDLDLDNNDIVIQRFISKLIRS